MLIPVNALPIPVHIAGPNDFATPIADLISPLNLIANMVPKNNINAPLGPKSSTIFITTDIIGVRIATSCS